MIQNVPSVYKQPSIYNGGGGLPGDFGQGGGVVPSGPTGYRQVAGVYIRDNVSAGGFNAYKEYNLNNDFGISKTDFTGVKFSGRFFVQQTRVFDGQVYFFRLRSTSSPAHTIQFNAAFGYHIGGGVLVTKLFSSNGSGESNGTQAGSSLYGVIEASLTGTTCKFGPSLTDYCAYNPPVTQGTPAVSPFVGWPASYVTNSNNIAVLDSRLHNADGDLMLHFVPVVRNSDSMPGLYELVHDVFCGNPYCNVIEKIEE